MCTENENSSYIVTVTKIIKKGENSPYSHNNKGFHERPDNDNQKPEKREQSLKQLRLSLIIHAVY